MLLPIQDRKSPLFRGLGVKMGYAKTKTGNGLAVDKHVINRRSAKANTNSVKVLHYFSPNFAP